MDQAQPLKQPLTRRNFISNLALTAGSLGGAALLDACASGGTASNSSTVSFMIFDSEFVKAERDEFSRRNPDIKLKFIPFDATRLNASIVAGNPPDLVRTAGAEEISYIVARGLATNLDPYFTKSSVLKVSDLESINNVYRWDGKTQGQGPRYGMAKDWSPDATVWYNKKLFDQAKVPYPSATEPMTYDQLLNIAKQVTVRQGSKITTYGLCMAWGEYTTYGGIVQMLAQKGLSLFSADYTTSNFTDPEVKKILQWYVDWAQAHVGPSPVDPDPNWSGTLFTAERAAMMSYGYWYQGFITGTNGSGVNKLSDHVGYAPAPLWGSNRLSTTFSRTGVYMSSASKNKDAAWKLYEYYMAGKPAQNRSSSGYGVPSLTSFLPNLPHNTPFYQATYSTLQSELAHGGTLHFNPYATGDQINSLIVKFIEPVMKGQTSLDEGALNLKNATDALLQQGKSLIG